jgi:hypothetical protein
MKLEPTLHHITNNSKWVQKLNEKIETLWCKHRPGAGGYLGVILATWEAESRRIVVQGQPKQVVWETPPICKITQAQWTRGVAQADKHLLCKHEAQFPTPLPAHTQKQTQE